MAGQPDRLTLIISDAGGQTCPVTFFIRPTESVTTDDLFTLFAEVAWSVVKPLVTGVLIKAVYSVEWGAELFTNNAPSALSDVEEKGVFSFKTSDGAGVNKLMQLSLPTIRETVFVNSGAGFAIDITDSDVEAFTVAMTTSMDDGGLSATDSHGNPVSGYNYGIQKFGLKRKI